MPEALVTNSDCANCGVPIRVNTQFCYNCGARLPADSEVAGNGISRKTQFAKKGVDEPGRGDLVAEAAEGEKLAMAAAARRQSRFKHRSLNEFTWKPVDSASNRVVLLIALLVAAVAAGIVFLMILWK